MSTLTKQDFEQLADILHGQLERNSKLAARVAIARVTLDVADWCAARNPRFDRKRFIDRVSILYLENE